MALRSSELVKWAERQGCEVTLTRGHHLAIRTPSGKVVYGSSTPGDVRAELNIKAKVRRVMRDT